MRILFQGDSITDGNRYKDEESRWDKNHQIGHSYLFIVAGTLGLLYPERNYEFINRGISGNCTHDLLARWERDALLENPDVLCVLVGTNDAHYAKNGIPSEDISDFTENYRKILTLSRERNPDLKIVLMGTFEYIPSQKDGLVPANIRAIRANKIREATKELAREFDALYISLQDKFEEAFLVKEPKYWLWDGTHPTEAGHALIAREFLDKTKEIFK